MVFHESAGPLGHPRPGDGERLGERERLDGGEHAAAERSMPPAVILAAGAGSRLRQGADGPPKPLTPLLGLTLVERTIRSCCAAGVREFIVIVGHRKDELTPYLRSLADDLGVRLRVAECDDWELGNGASALASEPHVRGAFFLLMGDHIFAPQFLRDLVAHDNGYRPCALVVDRDIETVHDVREATKVLLEDGKISAISKQLADFDGVDTGVFLCRPSLFDALRASAAAGEHTLGSAVQRLAEQGQVSWTPADGLFWQDIDTPEDLDIARSYLLTGNRATPGLVTA